jgi:hypothetical protein
MEAEEAPLPPLFRILPAPQKHVEALVERGVCMHSTHVSST